MTSLKFAKEEKLHTHTRHTTHRKIEKSEIRKTSKLMSSQADDDHPPTTTPHLEAYFPVRSKAATFVLTYSSYVLMKAANKSFSLVQPILLKDLFFSSPGYADTASDQAKMIATIATLFLAFYAGGQFFVGGLADRVNLRYFLSYAMIAAGTITIIF